MSTSTCPLPRTDVPRAITPRRVLLLLGACALVLLVLALRPSASDGEEIAGWLRGHGLAGAALLAAAYVIATLAALPVAAVTIVAGAAYGIGVGLLVVVPVAVLGALTSLAIGRTVLRRRLEARLGRDRRFAAIDRAIRDDGFRITLLVRLSPILPFGLLNYALSATSVRPRAYAAATAIGVVPGTLAYLYLGSLAGSGGGGDGQRLLCWGGLLATVLAIAAVTRAARRALARAAVADPVHT